MRKSNGVLRSWHLVPALAILAACGSNNGFGGAGGFQPSQGAGGVSGTDGTDQSPGSGGAAETGGTPRSPGSGGAASGGSTGQNQDSGTDGTTGPSATESCATLAHASCARISACSTFLLSVLYGDIATCEKRLAIHCQAALDAPQTGATPAGMVECANNFAQVNCSGILTGDFGAHCPPSPGALAAGAPCGNDSQCASTFCARASDAPCGVCAPPSKAGSSCVSGSCSAGTTCPAGGSVCVVPASGQVGAPCKFQEDCDLINAVGCNTMSGSCMKLTVAQGASCGANSMLATSYAVCPAAGVCSASLNGSCVKVASDGEACDSQRGPSCLFPARCVSGKCAPPNSASCQ